MVLLIDANILLDVLMNRQEFVTDSSMIWKLCETEQAKDIFRADLCKYNVYNEKTVNTRKIEEVFHKLNLIFEFTDFSPMILEKSVNMKWPDFEDAVQSATAEAIHADYIVTRNIKDFVKSKVVAFTPGELLARL